MTWTPEHQEAAGREGWGLFYVVENGAKTGRMAILSVIGNYNAYSMQQHVMESARRGSQLHIAALREVVQVAPKLKPRRKT